MKRVFIVLLLGLLVVFLQGTLRKVFSPGIILPNLFVIPVVFLAFHDVRPRGALLAFFLGLELDFASGILLGPGSGSLVFLYAILASLSKRIFIESTPALFLICFIGNLFSTILYLLLLSGSVDFSLPYSRILIESLITGVVAVFLYPFIRRCIGTEEEDGFSRVQRQY